MSWAFDNLPVVGFDDYHAPLPKPRGGYPQGCCERNKIGLVSEPEGAI